MPQISPEPDTATAGTGRRQVVLLGAVTMLGGAALSACSSGSATTATSNPPAAAGANSPSMTDPTGAAEGRESGSPEPMNGQEPTSGSDGMTTPSKKAAAKTTKNKADAAANAKGALAKLTSIPVGGSIAVGELILARPSANKVTAHSSKCTHMGCKVAPAGAGKVLKCPCHGASFNAADGTVLGGPAPKPLAVVKVVVKGGYVHRV